MTSIEEQYKEYVSNCPQIEDADDLDKPKHKAPNRKERRAATRKKGSK